MAGWNRGGVGAMAVGAAGANDRIRAVMNATAADSRTCVSRIAHVVANTPVSGGCHCIEARVEGEWPGARAGQFAMLSLDRPDFPLLPRPFSLLGSREVDGGHHVEFLIMPIGKGSGMLCALGVGEPLNVVGPLGGAMEQDLPAGPTVCVAGGYGVAPFVFLLEQWGREGESRAGSTTAVFGARTAERLSLGERLTAAAGATELCTDDGSIGFTGRVDAALAQVLSAHAERGEPVGMVLTCGPEAMMEAVGKVCRAADVPCRASLETYMGCGYAVCNGCAVAVGDPSKPEGYTYELACREGTVFDEERLWWKLL